MPEAQARWREADVDVEMEFMKNLGKEVVEGYFEVVTKYVRRVIWRRGVWSKV